MDEEIRTDEAEVVEQMEADPETPTEAAEQRTDDYDGLVRRLDDIAREIAARFDALDTAIGALGVSVIESGATITSESDAEDIIGDIMGIDALDLL